MLGPEAIRWGGGVTFGQHYARLRDSLTMKKAPTLAEMVELSPFDRIHWIRRGLPKRQLNAMAKALALSPAGLLRVLGLNPASECRRARARGRLTPIASERILRAAELARLGHDVFTSDAAVADWLRKPSHVLRGHAPFALLDCEPGIRLVKGLIRGMAHGVVM